MGLSADLAEGYDDYHKRIPGIIFDNSHKNMMKTASRTKMGNIQSLSAKNLMIEANFLPLRLEPIHIFANPLILMVFS